MAAGTITLPTISIPNVLAALAGPTYNISLEDDNWTAIKNALSGVAVSVAGEGYVFQGANLVEGTTTSLAEATLVTVASLAIATTSPFIVMASFRKTAGAAAAASIALRLNSTTIIGPDLVTTANNAAENGLAVWWVGPYDAVYTTPYGGFYGNAAISGGGAFSMKSGTAAARPNASITSVVIRGLVGDAAVTLGIKNVFVWALGVA